MAMSPEEILSTARAACEDKKAIDITALDIRGMSSLADYFLICSASSAPQMRAIVEAVDEALGRQGVEPRHREGYQSASWVLIDYGDVVIHVFHKDMRQFYNIERLWSDAKRV